MSAGDYIAGGRAVRDVPRTTAADSTEKVVEALARRTGPPTAFWGMLMLIASEGVLFGAMIGSFVYLRFNTRVWPPHADPGPEVLVPLILAACLTVTSLFAQRAWRAVREGRLAPARLLILATLVLQSAWFGYAVHDFADTVRKDPITTDAYSSIHFTLLGADHAHVLVGILLNVWLLAKLSRGLTTYRANAVQAIGWYTHFVVVLTWIVTLVLASAAV